MSCNNCKKDNKIINKHFNLCLECNNLRLHGSKYGKQYSMPKNNKTSANPLKIGSGNKKSKSLFAPTLRQLKKSTPKEDEAFYEECFNSSDHKCEECGQRLPTEFRDGEGKIIARWRYSHILAKSIAPELRHDIKNINHLCLQHHVQWDHGNKRSMNIFEKNRQRFPSLIN